MKATIDNIILEGTPDEIAKYMELTIPKVSISKDLVSKELFAKMKDSFTLTPNRFGKEPEPEWVKRMNEMADRLGENSKPLFEDKTVESTNAIRCYDGRQVVLKVSHNGASIGEMNLSQFAKLVKRHPVTVGHWFNKEHKVTYNGYTAIVIHKAPRRHNIRYRITDTKNDSRIFNSTSSLCKFLKVSHHTLEKRFADNPLMPIIVKGYTIEKLH